MLRLSRLTRSSRYTPIVGCAFLVEMLYGSKYSANLGAYNMPYVYVKTILLCATGHGLELREGRYIHGLIELLLPSKVSQDNLTKLELLQFVDAIPMDRLVEGHEAESEEEAEVQATVALMSGDEDVDHRPPRRERYTPYNESASSPSPSSHGYAHRSGRQDDGTDERGMREDSLTAQRRRQQEQEEEEDAAAVESIMSFVSPATFPSSMARVLIYDAVCTCVADGLYSAKEKERVALVSSHIGLSTAVRCQIEKLALQEKVLSIRKRRLLLLQRPPMGHTPLEEERLRQVSNVLSHSQQHHEDGGNSAEVPSHPQQQQGGSGKAAYEGKEASSGVLSDKAVAAVAAGRFLRPAAKGTRAENSEEVKRIMAAKELLRRARRQQKRQQPH